MSFGAQHVSLVKSLYRRSIRLSKSWSYTREEFLGLAWEARGRFRANMNVVDPKIVAQLLDNTEKELWKYRHPEPLIDIYSPDGSKYQRNLPPPIEFCDPHAQVYWPAESNYSKEVEH